MGHLNSWKGKKKAKEMCMEIPVIVLDQEGEVAFWSKLAGAGWVALDIWPDSNSQFYRKLPSWKISPSLTDPAYSFSSLPPIQSLCIYLPLLALLFLFSLSWVGQVPGQGLANAPFARFPSGNEENKMHTKAPIQAVLKQDRQLHNHRTSTRKDNSKVKLWPGRSGEHL